MTTGDSLPALVQKLTGGDETIAEAAALALALQPGALPALTRLMSDPCPDRRWWAVRALASFHEEAAIRAIASALGDPDLSVRQCALRALVENHSAELVPSLVPRLADQDPISARLAGEVLLRMGAEALPELVDVLETGTLPARIEAARALALMNNEQAIGPLYRALSDESAMVCHWAEEGLERMGQNYLFFAP
ncbi:MAG: HEAT repeat domain-containing protein [Anaerolineales bacterium]|jgi:HEAT repeat protein